MERPGRGEAFGFPPLRVYTARVLGERSAHTLWLVGMMGAGKSSVGRALAARLGREFVDTDAEIEKAAGASVREIFEREGEAVFRAREAS